MRHKKGFTLIELLVVIAIIGLLATIAIISLNNARQSSRDTRRISDMKQVQTAMELYFNDYTSYNLTCDSGLISACADPNIGTFLPGLASITDPGSNAYTVIETAAASFSFRFTTERVTDIGAAGEWYITEDGFSSSQ